MKKLYVKRCWSKVTVVMEKITAFQRSRKIRVTGNYKDDIILTVHLALKITFCFLKQYKVMILV